MTWDKKKKKFIRGDGVGADNVKLVRTENGTRLPATYRSGRFDEWKQKNRVSLPKVGEAEPMGLQGRRNSGPGGRTFRHNKETAAKPLDKLSNSYERKARQLKKQQTSAADDGATPRPSARGKGEGRGRYAGKSMGRVKSEIKTVDQIRKGRMAMERKRAKNARPSKKRGKR